MIHTEEIRELVNELGEVVVDKDSGGFFGVLPSAVFDDDVLPNVDTEKVTVDTPRGEKIQFPMYRAREMRGGFHLIAPEHVAAMWHDMDTDALEWEYIHRMENGHPIPPFLKDAVGDNEVSDS